MKRKIFTGVLTAAIALSMVGCGEVKEEDTNSSSKTNAAAEEASHKYTFLDENAKTEQLNNSGEGKFESADGAFSAELVESPKVENQVITFTFKCTNNTNENIFVNLSPDVNVWINDVGTALPTEPLSNNLASPYEEGMVEFPAGKTVTTEVSRDFSANSGKEIQWKGDGNDKVLARYSICMYIRLPEELSGGKYAYDGEYVNILYSSESTDFTCTM